MYCRSEKCLSGPLDGRVMQRVRFNFFVLIISETRLIAYEYTKDNPLTFTVQAQLPPPSSYKTRRSCSIGCASVLLSLHSRDPTSLFYNHVSTPVGLTNVPSEFSVCGVCPSDRLKVPLSVHVTSDTSVSDTDISLHTVESSCGRERRGDVRFQSAKPGQSLSSGGHVS